MKMQATKLMTHLGRGKHTENTCVKSVDKGEDGDPSAQR